jgi:hypothetical protein
MLIAMKAPSPARRTHLFIIRCWEEELGPENSEWRSKVQHVQSGEVRYFRAWPEMMDWMQAQLDSAPEDWRDTQAREDELE